MRKRPVLVLSIAFLLLAPVADFGQENRRLDSLKGLLTVKTPDTLTVNVLLSIAKEYSVTRRDSMYRYILLTEAMTEKINYVPGKVTVNSLYGSYYFHAGEYSKALSYNLKALQLNEQVGNKRGMAGSYRNIGSVYINSGNDAMALEYFMKAVDLSVEEGFTRDLGSLYANIAIVYHKQRNYGKAMEFNLKALKAAEEAGDLVSQSYAYNSLGKLFHDTGIKDENPRDFDKAIEYLEKSLKMKQQLGDQRGIANTLGNIAQVYMDKGDDEKALTCMKEGLEIAEQTNFKRWMLEGYVFISGIYNKRNDFKNAYEYYVKYSEIKDTLVSAASQKAMAEMQGKYDTDRQNKEIELLSKDNELNHTKLSRQKFIIGAVVVGLVVVLVFAFFIYRGYKDKQRINSIIEEKNKNITDSIKYAKRIQTAILPSQEIIRKRLTDVFILYRPKDIVSGDFYFFAEAGTKTIIAAADCTGHGVPGAFMSMIGNSLLNQIIKEDGITQPSEVLNLLNSGVREALKQDEAESDTRDGMDIALCTIDHVARTIEFAGANRNLYIVRKGSTQGEAEEVKSDKFAIGGLQAAAHNGFSNHSLTVAKGDTIYLSTDGYADQFGGKDGKKFRTRRFRELLTSIAVLGTAEQEKKLEETLVAWMGNAEQLDDILVLGIRL